MAVVRRNIDEAAKRAGRRPEDIALVCVTKQASIEQIKEAIGLGITNIAENRVQDAVEKHEEIASVASLPRNDGGVRWHLIGHLQTNKVKKAVEIFDLIHSVDSLRLAEEISKEAAKIGKVQDILIQVNTSGEETKFGITPEELKSLIVNIVRLNNINILGLMTIAPLVDDVEKARTNFRKLNELSEELKIFLRSTKYDVRTTALSMGMSNDYQVAIEEGATIVRIGSAIFK